MSTRAPNPLGPPVDDTPRPWPSRDITLTGRYVKLVGLRADHAASLYPYVSAENYAHLWDYMLDDAPTSLERFQTSLYVKQNSKDTVFYAILSTQDPDPLGPEGLKVLGVASYLRIDPKHQSIEVGNIMYSPALQRTPAATEAMLLMARYAFEELKYRRYEWKCNALNAPSVRAAGRLGFTAEGIFRKHFIIRGRNRDTAWFSMLDDEWPERKKALEGWLEPSNFDAGGQQRKKLEDFRT